MARKKQTETLNFVQSFAERFKQNALDLFNRTIRERIRKIEKITVEIILGLLFFVLGLFFVLTAGVFFLNEAAHLSLFAGFFLVGVLALGVASIFYFLVKHS